MNAITTQDGAQIYYKDWGSGQPAVFSHGWALSADDWDAQMLFLLKHAYRVIAHDRRGHGRSTQTGGGHNMDHYAHELAALTTTNSRRICSRSIDPDETDDNDDSHRRPHRALDPQS